MDELGSIVAEGISGVAPRRGPPEDARRRLQPLMELRDQIIATTPEEDGVVAREPLPGEKSGPQPVDSGDPNPDRMIVDQGAE